MHEIGTAFFYEEMKITRTKGAWIETVVCCVISVLCALSCGAVPEIQVLGMDFLDFCDHLTSQYMMPLGAFATCILLGWLVPKKILKDEFTNWGTLKGAFFGIYYFMVRFVCPLCILVIFLHQLGVF